MRKKIALLLRGITYHPCYHHHTGIYLDIDFRHNLANVRELITNIQKTHDMDLFIATYESDLSPAIVTSSFDKCKAIVFLSPGDKQQADCLSAGLKLIDNAEDYDLVVVSRFDLKVIQDINELRIDWSKFNLLWKENTLLDSEQVGDCMFFFHPKYLEAMHMALHDCDKKKTLHHIKKYLDSYLIDTDYNFLFAERYNSNSDKFPNPLYTIQRKPTSRPNFYSKFLGYSAGKYKHVKR